MATVGDILTAPEAGWKRYKCSDSRFTYTDGTWILDSNYDIIWAIDGKIKFKFVGTKLRILIQGHPNHSGSVDVYIDGTKTVNFSEKTSSDRTSYILACDIQNLSNKEHYVVIEDMDSTANYTFQAIDIDETGDILPHDITDDKKLLRVTLIDSSDHDYQLSSDEISAFVKWYNGHANTDTHAYGLGKKIGTQASTEYVAFEKIISFEVI
ncbi:hypothetical protein SAMN05660742_10655 [Propionispira arboris]|uniref:Uncharacterized protein n=1 Tax=Propionispira arboris TaxID=84035 RepID=A0A1H6Y2W6_9FIRM|nr:hypothetical protein [Propionispira arboris]SEJ34776.1 hypothetical protein SAMN05660742_10655 [Propionispira arboris]